MAVTKSYLDNLIDQVNSAALEVHKAMGPGLLECIYQQCMRRELMLKGLTFQSDMLTPVLYKGEEIDTELRCNLFVEDVLVVEIRAAESFSLYDRTQLNTYMSLLQAPKGLLLNFNTTDFINEGQRIYVNELYNWIREG